MKNKNNNSFRLSRFNILQSSDYEEGDFTFYNESETEEIVFPYTTLIIGPNGTGKSRLLRALVEVLVDLYNSKHVPENNVYKQYASSAKSASNQSGFIYELSYYFNKDYYFINSIKGDIVVIKNKSSMIPFIDVPLPAKAIAAAYSLYEKFTPKENNFFSKLQRNRSKYNINSYEYLGVKVNNNSIFTSGAINNSIDLITRALAKTGFDKDVESVFKVLEFLPMISIQFVADKNRTLFTGNLNFDNLPEALNKISFQQAGYSYSAIERLRYASQDELAQIINSLNEVARASEGRQLTIDLFFDRTSENNEFNRIYEHVALLRSINLLRYAEIIVHKKSKQYPEGRPIKLRSMSSGEIQILTSFLSLAAVVEDNSIIFIDEPEISLHPNWQMQYIDLLNKIFTNSKSCHFIIATHSHFLASDIPLDSSAILALTRNSEQEITAELLDSAYGNSAENILYNIFGVATVRNLYFEGDINELLYLLKVKSKNYEKINQLIDKFSKFKLGANDPLAVLINDARKYLKKI